MTITPAPIPTPFPLSHLPHFDLGGAGLPLHFIHANGYPPACYNSLFELLQSHYHVFGMLLRPLWPDSKPEEIQDWKIFSKDLLQFLGSYTSEPVIGVGHSIGAIVTLRAALKDPDRFRALILIDPVLYIPSFMARWQLVRVLGLGDRVHPLIARTQKRRRTFDNLDVVFRGYRSRSVFRYMSDEDLRRYIQGITRLESDGTYSLVYSPEWEAQVYRTAMHDFDIWNDLPKLEVPALFIRGAETDTFMENAARLVKRKQPKAQVVMLEKSTHLLPLERPREVFEIMQSFLQEALKLSETLKD